MQLVNFWLKVLVKGMNAVIINEYTCNYNFFILETQYYNGSDQ